MEERPEEPLLNFTTTRIMASPVFAFTCCFVLLLLASSCVQRPSSELRPPARPLQPAAEVNGEVITLEAVEKALAEDRELSEETRGLEERYAYLAKISVLEKMIAEVLIRKEAQRRGISPEALVESIIRGISVVSEEEVETSYRLAKGYKGENPMIVRRVSRLLAGSEPEAKERIREFLRQQKIQGKILEFAYRLKKQANVTIHLKGPVAKRGQATFILREPQ